MEHDELVLSQLSDNQQISQRQLAQQTNLSLGQLNLILHRLVSRGWVKIEKISARSLRYVLTPQGIARNTKRTYNFVRSAYQQILHVQNQMITVIRREKAAGRLVCLPKTDDEVHEILHLLIREHHWDAVRWVDQLADLAGQTAIKVIVWTEDDESICRAHHLPYDNILHHLPVEMPDTMEAEA